MYMHTATLERWSAEVAIQGIYDRRHCLQHGAWPPDGRQKRYLILNSNVPHLVRLATPPFSVREGPKNVTCESARQVYPAIDKSMRHSRRCGRSVEYEVRYVLHRWSLKNGHSQSDRAEWEHRQVAIREGYSVQSNTIQQSDSGNA